MDASQYDRLTIRLHWATAALVVLLWATAQVIDLFPKGTPRVDIRSVHVVLGVVLALVLAWRLGWRATGSLKLAGVGPMRWAAGTTHMLLYVLLVASVLLGVVNVWVRGDSIFELFNIPAYVTSDKTLRHTIASLHRWCANVLFGVAGLHAVASLIHHHVLRDDVLARMWPARRRRGAASSIAAAAAQPTTQYQKPGPIT
jgi:cytochrome b561